MKKLKSIPCSISYSEYRSLKINKFRVIKGENRPNSVHEDIYLWGQFSKGCESSFAMLYQKYFTDLYRYGLKTCKEKEIVKDCIHDLFVDLWNKRKKLKPITNTKHYLLTAIKRRLINHHLRSKKVTYQDSFNDKQSLFSLSIEREMIDIQNLKAKKACIAKALNLLSERQRKVLYLRFYENYSNKEIADNLAIDITSTYNLMSKALKRFKSNLTYPSAI